MKRAVLFLLLNLTICAIYAQSQPVSQRLDALLNDEILKTSEVGITVFDLTTGESLYRYQDEKLYRPASIEKVITSVTALARLGADYTMDTHLRYTGKIENDTLKGNLYLIGGFDPELMDEDLDSLVAAVEAQGIRYVTDTIAADVSMTDSVYWGYSLFIPALSFSSDAESRLCGCVRFTCSERFFADSALYSGFRLLPGL